MQKRKVKKAFTLVEMLIVVVIIGILAAALIPKLVGAQERARDTARKGNLNNANTYLTQYFGDMGVYTGSDATKSLKDIEGDLVPKYASALPTDPMNTRVVKILAAGDSAAGQYAYQPMFRNGTANAGMIIAADVEMDGTNANFVKSSDTADDTLSSVHGCDTQCTSKLSSGKVSSGANYTDSRDLQRVLCNTGVTMVPADPSKLSTCHGKTDPDILYVVVK